MNAEALPLGERQGDLVASTKERRWGKTLNFGLPSPDPKLTVMLAPIIVEVVRTLVRRASADRLVAEIGPWMLSDRQRRANNVRKT